MSSWRDAILNDFVPNVSKLTLVADPDCLLTEENEWRHELQSARQIVPEIRSLLMLRIIPQSEKGSAYNE